MNWLIKRIKYAYVVSITMLYIFALIFLPFWFWMPYLVGKKPELVLEWWIEYMENYTDENELF